MLRPGRTLPPIALALLTASLAQAADLPSINALKDAAPVSAPVSAPGSAPGSAPAPVSVPAASIDEARGVPTFLWATGSLRAAPPSAIASSPEIAAAHHLRNLAAIYKLSDAALKTATINLLHDTGQGGIIVGFSQNVGGIELFQTRLRLLLSRNGGLIAAGGNLHPAATPDAQSRLPFTVPITNAVTRALNDLYALPSGAADVTALKKTKAGYQYFSLVNTPTAKGAPISFTRESRARKVFFPMPDRLVPAYYVEIFAQKAGAPLDDAYAYVIAADDGRVLYRESLTQFESFQYRVWADDSPTHRPLDGPHADFSPHPTGVPDGSRPAYIAPSLITMAGFNTSPNGTPDPWLMKGALETNGNNVDCYTDHGLPDGFSNGDLRASITGPGVFDRTYDTSLDPIASDDQSMASVAQLFYVNNWLHDYWYDSGFNEAAGNAQASNYGRGGVDGDALRAEAQDGVLLNNRNNANMMTPADGEHPRMQMYLWSGKETRTLDIQPLNVAPKTGAGGFGALNFSVSGELAQPDDGVDPITDGCAPFITTSVDNKIALVDRGDCFFKLKAYNAEAAGAIAVIIANNSPEGDPKGGVIGMSDGAPELTVTIPALFISKEDGDAIKAAMANGAVTATLFREVQVANDGTIDNGIIAHEWGHYLHNRLVSCGNSVCRGMGEGWADFNALHMLIREGDNLDGAFATGAYAASAFTDPFYYGIRRAPYSTDMSKNPFTFKHVANGEALPTGVPLASTSPTNAEVHNTGEIWSNMLFEGFISLLKKSQSQGAPYTFEEARRRMSDYIVAGMMLTPPMPTFTEQRDGVLAAAFARDKDDGMLLAQGFAKRGMGSCAVSPNRYSGDNAGVVESYELKPRVAVTTITIDDSVKSCDGDGFLDAEETGKVSVEVVNASPLPLFPGVLELTSSDKGVSFPTGASVVVPALEPFEAKTLTLDIKLTTAVTAKSVLDLTATVTNNSACEKSVLGGLSARVDFDNVAEKSSTETFESDLLVWTPSGPGSEAIWKREQATLANYNVRGADASVASDTSFVSPPLHVSSSDDLVVSFKHTYSFERTADKPETPDDETIYWDGGVVEISSDDGKSWTDIGKLADPGYNGVIGGDDSINVLLNRSAFVGQNASAPGTDPVSIDLGSTFAGQTVRVRFRIATDASGAGVGWVIDDIAFKGITNTPFPIFDKDISVCQRPPIANAGKNKEVAPGVIAMLNATESSDPDGDPLSFSWKQIAGPAVDLDGGDTATPTFKAPALGEESKLSFEVLVSDGKDDAKDSVTVTVRAIPADGAGGAGGGNGVHDPDAVSPAGGCDCATAGQDRGAPPKGAAFAAAASLALGLLRRRRRRSA